MYAERAAPEETSVSLEQPVTPAPPDLSTLNRFNASAVAYWFVISVWAALLAVLWNSRGPGHPLFAVLITLFSNALLPGIAVPVTRWMPLTWCRVPTGEGTLHRFLGIPGFARFLERSGWNRQNALLPRNLTRKTLPARFMASRGGLAAHGACFVLHLLLAVAAGLSAHPGAAVAILLPGVATHLYPALLQRSILLRLQPLLARYGADRAAGGQRPKIDQ